MLFLVVGPGGQRHHGVFQRRGNPASRHRREALLFETGGRLPDFGLAVAHGFVTAMGGTIAALDTPGGGLTMAIALPVAGSATVAP